MPIKILSVDDEIDLEELLSQYFRRKIRKGIYEFYFAHNGLEALTVLYNHPDIDIVLSDINMPKMDGFELLKKLKDMNNPAMKVIMVSAFGEMNNIRQAMNDGAFDFATKPINLDDLQCTIDKAVEEIEYVHKMQAEHSQLESIKGDLVTASEIQKSLLPDIPPLFLKPEDELDIAASMNAAKNIGGDLYDCFRIDDDRIGFLIGDVCGKGVPAALFMAVSRTIIHALGVTGKDSAACLTQANALLAAESVNCMFLTVFYGIYDTKTGHVSYCNGGHNPPYIMRKNGELVELPKSKDMMVGAFEGIEYHAEELQLEHGDTLVMFTDGVTEAMNTANEEFGNERLKDTLEDVVMHKSEEIVNAIKADVAVFTEGAEQSDDITMLVIRRL